jgi:hypothetical protein
LGCPWDAASLPSPLVCLPGVCMFHVRSFPTCSVVRRANGAVFHVKRLVASVLPAPGHIWKIRRLAKRWKSLPGTVYTRVVFLVSGAKITVAEDVVVR